MNNSIHQDNQNPIPIYFFGNHASRHVAQQLLPSSCTLVEIAPQHFLTGVAVAGSLVLGEVAPLTPEIIACAQRRCMPVIGLIDNLSPLPAVVNMGLDDYFLLPLQMSLEEARVRFQLIIARLERSAQRSPLTQLPGNVWLQRMVTARLGEPLAVVLFDIDHFKAFNDRYGFARGDEVLVATARMIVKIVASATAGHGVVGHVGGDDFLLLCEPPHAVTVAREVAAAFDVVVPGWYELEERVRGSIQVINRRGVVEQFPLMALSIAIVTNEKKQLTSWPQIATLMAELKRYAKSKPGGFCGSNWVQDRRGE